MKWRSEIKSKQVATFKVCRQEEAIVKGNHDACYRKWSLKRRGEHDWPAVFPIFWRPRSSICPLYHHHLSKDGVHFSMKGGLCTETPWTFNLVTVVQHVKHEDNSGFQDKVVEKIEIHTQQHFYDLFFNKNNDKHASF